ncbi:O-antigen ligase family protein [Candidatus Peregrinibacteria bacterium]|nr:O-antigen ligase family protein [Candidatus Peregrinibacteria bacterium]
MFLPKFFSRGLKMLTSHKIEQRRICHVLSVLLFGAYFFGVLYRGGIGTAASLVMWMGIGLSGIIFWWAIYKKIYKEREFPIFENVFLVLMVVFFSLSCIYSSMYVGGGVAGGNGLGVTSGMGNGNVGIMGIGSLYAGVILVFLGYSLGKDKAHVERLFKVLSFSVLLSIVIGFVAYFSGAFERFAGSFNNFLEPWSAFPNAFGDFLILIMPLTLYLIEKKKKRLKGRGWKKIWGKVWAAWPEVTFVASVAALILTESQGVYLVAIVLLVALLLRAVVLKLGVNRLVAMVLIGVVLAVGSMYLKEYFDTDYREGVAMAGEMVDGEMVGGDVIDGEAFENVSSVNKRLEHFKVGFELMTEAPLLGFGPGSYPYISAPKVSLLNTAEHPHNLFLKIGVENGALALGAFIIFLGIAFGRSVYSLFRKLDPIKELVCFSLGAFLLHHMIDFNLNFTSVSFVFFILIGVLIVEKTKKWKRLHVKNSHFVNHFLLCGLGIVLVIFSIAGGVQKLHADGEMDGNMMRNDVVKSGMIRNGEIWSGGNENIDYATAYEMNPHNLRYLLGLYETSTISKQRALRSEIREVLEEYLFLLETNTHFTILTDNPIAALSLARLIGDPDLEIIFEEVIESERLKFSRLYGVEF